MIELYNAPAGNMCLIQGDTAYGLSERSLDAVVARFGEELEELMCRDTDLSGFLIPYNNEDTIKSASYIREHGEDQTADFLRFVKTSPLVLATREANKDLNALAEEHPAVAEAIAAVQRVLNTLPTTKSDDVVALEWLIKHMRIVIKAEAERAGVAEDNDTVH